MRKAFWSIVFILWVPFCLGFFPNTGYAQSVRWHGYEEGLALAKKENKKVFLYFWADWCGYCEKMEKETLSKKEVASILNKRFVPIKLNSDAEQRLASQYFVRGLPTTWFLTDAGEKISNLPGYVDPDMFVPILRYIDSNSYKNMSFKEFLDKK